MLDQSKTLSENLEPIIKELKRRLDAQWSKAIKIHKTSVMNYIERQDKLVADFIDLVKESEIYGK